MDLIFSAILKPLTLPVDIVETRTVTVAYFESYKARPFPTNNEDYAIKVFSSYFRPDSGFKIILLLKYVEGLDLEDGETAVIGMALNYPDFQMDKISSNVIDRQLHILKGEFDDPRKTH